MCVVCPGQNAIENCLDLGEQCRSGRTAQHAGLEITGHLAVDLLQLPGQA